MKTIVLTVICLLCIVSGASAYEYKEYLYDQTTLAHLYEFTEEEILNILKQFIGEIPNGEISVYPNHQCWSFLDTEDKTFITFKVKEPVTITINHKPSGERE